MAKSYDFSRLTVLLVDDNLFMASIIKTYLREFGVTSIFEAVDGTDALEQTYSIKPDIIIVDYMMPNFDGLDFIRLIRTAPDSPNPRVPIILTTAYADRYRIISARDAGASEILTKPISATDLYRRLVMVIERPRKFIVSKSYTGPCRRRRADPHWTGPERRNAVAAEPGPNDAKSPEPAPGEAKPAETEPVEAKADESAPEEATPAKAQPQVEDAKAG